MSQWSHGNQTRIAPLVVESDTAGDVTHDWNSMPLVQLRALNLNLFQPLEYKMTEETVQKNVFLTLKMIKLH